MAPSLKAVALLALLTAPLAAAKTSECSAPGKNCSGTGCCTPQVCHEKDGCPAMKCFQKDKSYAVCTGSCKPGIHYTDPPQYQSKWSCVELTWGCSGPYEQCGGNKNFEGPFCCHWGCTCNKTNSDYHQCMPPKGQQKCMPEPKAESEAESKAQVIADAGPEPAAAPARVLPAAAALGLAAGVPLAAAAAAALALRRGGARAGEGARSLGAELE